MTKIFALLALLLIASGVIVLAVPKPAQPVVTERSLGPLGTGAQSIADQARDIAEKVNAPLSILFGFVSLYYSRRNYIQNRDALARRQAG
ncbi:MAG: hypothetical protein C0519_02955 [Hyphomicrobium sp.]|jgi:uncharacterized membrane protein|nr:hypothetical protein [Hyphomicrobium sp.]PPD08965.1 MAG: hypothetical protein CTY28_02580 [Hyphomicrobium sp.]